MFEATIAGSLPKPGWLAETDKLWPQWKLAGEELAAAKRDATLLWLKEQEDAGLDIVGDGEQSRQHFVHGFLEFVDGIDFEHKVEMGIRKDRYKAMVPQVVGPLKLKGRVHQVEARLARSHTKKKLKITLPGPMTIVDTVADRYYGDRVKMAMAFAELLNQEARALEADGVDVIQFDEPAFNVYTDDAKSLGHHRARPRRPGPEVQDCRAHLLRLRHQGQRRLEGHARLRVAPVRGDLPGDREERDPGRLARVHELACADAPDEAARRQDLLVGVIDVASDVVETPEQVADTIGKALQFVAKEHLSLHQLRNGADEARDRAGEARGTRQGCRTPRQRYGS